MILSIVGVGAVLWGFGFVYPKPDCCGSGSGSAMMSLTADGKAVTVTALFFNSSGRDLRVSAASADLGGTTPGRLVITFVPTTCHDGRPPWGKVTVRLDVMNGWLPSIGRSYTLPVPVVDAGQATLSVFRPEGLDISKLTTPLASACALLGR